MPRNSDFPDYKGIKVDHVNDWSANDYHNQSLHPVARKETNFKPPSDMKGVFSPKRTKKTTDTDTQDHEVKRAAAQEWRTRGLSNNEIQDY